MADELITEPSEAEKRIKTLSEKVRLTAEERDEKDRLLTEQTGKTETLQKERDFYASFSDVLAQNPKAKDHKDDIKNKVLAGYTVEDATFAVLGKLGKLGQPKPPEEPSPAGGSAPTTPPQGGEKDIGKMNREEKRAALIAAQESGDLSLT